MDQGWLTHNSHLSFYRSPFGAVPCGETIRIRLAVSRSRLPDRVFFCLEREGWEKEDLEMLPRDEKDEKVFYQITFKAPSSPGLLWYHFRAETEGEVRFCGSSLPGMGGPSRTAGEPPSPYQITVHNKGASTPHWFKDAIIYQIFPDRFFNGLKRGRVQNPKKNSLIHSHWDNSPFYIRDPEKGDVVRWDFFGGNLLGVLKKLPYLKRLGVSVLYFNPIFLSPSNHRYDTADYHRVDPMLGTNKFFAYLCRRAREMGISVILDGVFSHTGSDSIYFNKEGNYPGSGAYQSPHSPYYKWYRFTEYPGEYETWWGIKTMPNVKEMEPSYREFIIHGENSVVKHWLKLGAAGWRLDVADELPTPFIRRLRREMKEMNHDYVLVGEVWEDASNKISYGERRSYLLGEELDSVMNYPFRSLLIDFLLGGKDAGDVERALLSQKENYPKENYYSAMNLLGSHDQPRILSVLAGSLPPEMPEEDKKEIARYRLMLAVFWQMTFPGAPSIYYGDESGLEGGEDPQNRRGYPWGREDMELLQGFREMTALRRHYDVLRTGEWLPLYARGDVFCFLRKMEGGADIFGQKKTDNTALILINRNPFETRSVEVDAGPWLGTGGVDVLDDNRELDLEEGYLKVDLRPLEGKLVLKDRWGAHHGWQRECGILLHPTSLPGPYGIGSLGKEAFAFVDFLQESGQSLWQVLPLNPPSYGESPYQCYSAFAGNPMLVDLEDLVCRGLLKAEDLAGGPSFPADSVCYSRVAEYKGKLLSKAHVNFLKRGQGQDYQGFLDENKGWLEDYALFMALKDHFGGRPWFQWDRDAAFRDDSALKTYQERLGESIEFQKFLQYLFFRQWQKLKEYANKKRIRIIGDLPIFVAHDSSDVWTHPHLFQLDDGGYPLNVAGVPPDYFSETGQLWGNPHYRWKEMARDDYKWWRERFQTLAGLVDVIRIDHFRGFEAYWEVPGGEDTALKGRWVKGPGERFFRVIEKYLGRIPVIAEDLGVITPAVEDLKQAFGYPGMKILQFVLEEKPEKEFSLPLSEKNTVAYTGTHDNDTILGWYREKYRGFKDLQHFSDEEICWYFIEQAYRSNARVVIIPLQDVLCLDTRARMNVPGTTGGNWRWRYPPGSLTGGLAHRLKALAKTYAFMEERPK